MKEKKIEKYWNNQNKRTLNRDIKIESKKIDNIGIKLIFHVKSDGKKEFRIFISMKNENSGKLIRKRFKNSKIEKIQNDEEKMIEFFKSISDSKELKKILFG